MVVLGAVLIAKLFAVRRFFNESPSSVVEVPPQVPMVELPIVYVHA